MSGSSRVLSGARNRLGAATRIRYPWLRDPGQLGRNSNIPMLPSVYSSFILSAGARYIQVDLLS